MEPSDYIDDVEPTEEVAQNPAILEVIPKEFRGERMDKALAVLFPEYSRSRIQQWLEAGSILVNGLVSSSKEMVLGGEQVQLSPPIDPQNSAFFPENIPLDLLYEDAHVAVINKPAGMVVHPAVGNWSGTLLNAILYRFPECSEVPRAGIVHRLDKDTSGILVIAKTLQAQNGLVKQLQDRSMKRRYLALVWGKTPSIKTIHTPIGRDQRDRLKMGVTHTSNAKEATTHVQTIQHVLFEERELSLIRCQLETGRTHQIRVHLESIGHPLVNDPLYKLRVPQEVSRALLSFMQTHQIQIPGQLLHAAVLGFVHPITAKELIWQVNPPVDVIRLFEQLGLNQELWNSILQA